MKNQVQNGHILLFKGSFIVSILLLCWFPARLNGQQQPDAIDTIAIQRALTDPTAALICPAGTREFYARNNFRPVWSVLTPGKKLWDALLLLDCALQYGLNHHDYHPDELTYDQLYALVRPGNRQKAAQFEILLTDAMIAMINNLHYGKLNPLYSPASLEKTHSSFAGSLLSTALKENDLVVTIQSAQPRFPEYQSLQLFLHLMTGQYVGDSYEASESQVRQIAVNMERWRWEQDPGTVRAVVNIPAFTLTFTDKNEETDFRVIVGKPGNPSPILFSRITHFSTAPDWNVPERIFRREILPKALKNPLFLDNNHYQLYSSDGRALTNTIENVKRIAANKLKASATQSPGCDNALGNIVFRFENRFNIYLHDTPDKSLFKQNERAFSHGCIRLEHPEQFAHKLLSADGSTATLHADLDHKLDAGLRKTFVLATPVPMVTRYMTCALVNGLLVTYPDVYARDVAIATSLFGSGKQLVSEMKEFTSKKETGFKVPANMYSLEIK